MFQSTHSLRSATLNNKPNQTKNMFQSTHSLRSATVMFSYNSHKICKFQSTHSLRSATKSSLRPPRNRSVSIHALLAECDMEVKNSRSRSSGFNPRTPCGVRQDERPVTVLSSRFQSTHSLRSATVGPSLDKTEEQVSIHALLAECDLFRLSFKLSTPGFNPRTPCGVRLAPSLWALTMFRVSIHALLAECDGREFPCSRG